MRVLLLTGPPGAGKSTTVTALMGAFEAEGARYAAVEVEALALVHPWPDDDAAFDHLRYVSRSFERRGYPLLLAAATITGEGYFQRLRDALPTEDVVTVGLVASVPCLRSRILTREPSDWVGLPRLVEAAAELAASTRNLAGLDLLLDTENLTVREVVAGIRSRIPALDA